MTSYFIAALIAAGLLCGCAATPEQLSTQTDMQLCRSYRDARNVGGLIGDSGASQLREIQRRNLLSTSELDLVRAKQVQRGMSLCALYASWGVPDRENRSVGAWGTRIQHVYHAGLRHTRPTYVYTENGSVTAWQD